MEALFFQNFSKRKNSTKRPDLSTGTAHNVVFKEMTSIENPTLKIQGVNLNYNYMYMNGQYYFIDDIRLSINNIYEVSCTMDPLASNKGYIENYTGLIYRTSAAIGGNSGLIRDGNIQGLEVFNYDKYTIDYPGYDNTGCYIVKAASPQYGRYYFLRPSELQALLDAMNREQMFNNTEPWKNILFIRYTPFAPSFFGNLLTTNMMIGNKELTFKIDDTPINVYYSLYNFVEKGPLTIDSSIPFLENFGDWRDYASEWTNIELMFFNNKVSLPIEYNRKVIYCSFVYDFATGYCTVKALDRNSLENMNSEVFNIHFSFAFDIQVAQMTASLTTLANGYFGLAGNILSGNAMGALSSSFNTYNGVIASNPAVVGQLTDMSCLKWAPQIYIFRKRRKSGDMAMTESGTPVCINRRIGDLPEGSYIQMVHASVNIPGFGAEKDKVNNYLNGGFYYE